MGTRGSNGSVEVRMHGGGTKAPVVAGIAALTGAAGAALGAIGVKRFTQDKTAPADTHDDDQPGQPAPRVAGTRRDGTPVDHNGLPSVASGVMSKDSSQVPADEGNESKQGKKGGEVKAWMLKLDRFQQSHTWAAFPYAVIKKFGDDEAGNLAALIAYYGIGSLFPLLLVFLTVLGFVLSSHPTLRDSVVHSTFSQFPIIGDQIQKNVHSLKGSGVGLVVGLAGTLYGGLGVANAAQNALNRVWEVPIRERPTFVKRLVRSLLLLLVGAGVIGTSLLSGIGSGSGVLGAGFRVVLFAVSVVLNVTMFVLAFRILTARDVPWKNLVPGAAMAAIGWQVLQVVGGYYVGHQLKGASQSYGFFAVVLGLMSWLYLEAQLVLLSAEVNVVLAGRLWPRALTQEQRTDADERAYASYAEVEERRRDEDVDVGFVSGTGQATIDRSQERTPA